MIQRNAFFAFLFLLYLSHLHNFCDEYHDVSASFLYQCMVLERYKHKEEEEVYGLQLVPYVYLFLNVDYARYFLLQLLSTIVILHITLLLCHISRVHVNEYYVIIFLQIEQIVSSNLLTDYESPHFLLVIINLHMLFAYLHTSFLEKQCTLTILNLRNVFMSLIEHLYIV